MNVEGVFYVNQHLEKLMFDELRNACRPGMVGGFLPGVKQVNWNLQLKINALMTTKTTITAAITTTATNNTTH